MKVIVQLSEISMLMMGFGGNKNYNPVRKKEKN